MIDTCPDCGTNNVVISSSRDQVICRECGLIFEPFTPLEKPAPAKTSKKAKKPVQKKKK